MLALLLGCVTPHERNSAINDFYNMENGCRGLTNKFLNATANTCEQEVGDDDPKMTHCVARAVGQACLLENRGRQACALECVQDVAHPDR